MLDDYVIKLCFLKQTGNLPNRLYKNILYISMNIYGIIIIRWEVSHSKILQVQLGCLPIFRRSAAISLRPILFVCIGARKNQRCCKFKLFTVLLYVSTNEISSFLSFFCTGKNIKNSYITEIFRTNTVKRSQHFSFK